MLMTTRKRMWKTATPSGRGSLRWTSTSGHVHSTDMRKKKWRGAFGVGQELGTISTSSRPESSHGCNRQREERAGGCSAGRRAAARASQRDHIKPCERSARCVRSRCCRYCVRQADATTRADNDRRYDAALLDRVLQTTSNQRRQRQVPPGRSTAATEVGLAVAAVWQTLDAQV